MSCESLWPTPAWLAEIPDVELQRARTRFYLGLATVYLGERCSLTDLAAALDVTPKTLHNAKDRGQISPQVAIAIETLLGRELFPRELFRPDLFSISE